MQSQNKAQDKNALREKNRISAKQFIKMKRGKIKEEKANSASFEQIRAHIRQGRAKQFEQSLFSLKDQSAFTFLFSENELKQTPIMEIIVNKECCSLLKSLNGWSCRNTDLIVRLVYMQDNQLRNNDFRGKFHNMNKVVLQTLNRKVGEWKSITEQIMLLGEKDSIYYHLCKNFLSLEVIISSLSALKANNNMLIAFYQPLLNKSDLEELKEVAMQAKGYESIVLRQRLWSKVDSSILQSITAENIGLLTLKELNYNVWHQLANHSPSQFMKLAKSLADRLANQEPIAEDVHSLLLMIDSSAQIPMDKCLRLWSHNQLRQLFLLTSQIQNLTLSTKCLIKIFYNRRLSKSDRQNLIVQCLSGEISKKGYIKVLPRLIQKKCTKADKTLLKVPLKYTYNICYDSLQAKKQKDCSGAYPLVIYLQKYKKDAKLQIIQKLLIESLTPKYIKKQMKLLGEHAVKNRVKIQNTSQKKQQIQSIIDYYQPLWKTITYLPHGDVLEYLLTKIQTNCFEIKLEKYSHYVYIEPIGTHFIVYYIQNNPELGENTINKSILSSIVNCKSQAQRVAQNVNLNKQLIRSLNKIQAFHTSTEYLVVQLRKHLRSKALNLTSEDLMSRRQVQQRKESSYNELMIDVLCFPYLKKKASLLTEEEIATKVSAQTMNRILGYDQDYNEVITWQLRKYYQDFARKYKILPEIENKVDFAYLSHCNLFSLQRYYSTLRPQAHNENFFNGLQDYFSSVDKIELSRQGKWAKYYCFRLRPTEKYLTYKFKQLLILGMDVYFSTYDNFEGFSEESTEWNSVMKRMVQYKCSFLSALISEPTASFATFQEIFLHQGKTQTSWIKWSLFYKIRDLYRHYFKIEGHNWDWIYINQIKQSFYFCNNIPTLCNYQFVHSLTKYAAQLKFPQKICVEILQRYFQINVNSYSLQIQSLQSQYLQSKEEQTKKKIQGRKAAAANFIDKWMPSLMKEINSIIASQNNENVTKEYDKYSFGLLERARSRKQQTILKALLKHQSFQTIPKEPAHKIFHLLQYYYSPSPSAEFSKFFCNLPEEKVIGWVDYMIRWEIQALARLIKSFSFRSQAELVQNILQRIEGNEEQQALSFRNTYNTFIGMVIRCMDAKDSLKLLEVFDRHGVNSEEYKRQLLRAADDAQRVIVGLIVLRPYDRKCFYLREEGKIRLFSNASFYHKCSNTLFEMYIQKLEQFHSRSPNIKMHLKTVIICLVESQQWERLKLLMSIKPLLKETVLTSLQALGETLNTKKKEGTPVQKEIVKIIFSYLQKIQDGLQQRLFHSAFKIDFRQAFKIFKPKTLSLQNIKKCIQAQPQCSSLLLAFGVGMEIVEKFHPKFMANYFPIIAHDTTKLSKQKWIIDELKFQRALFSQLKASHPQFRLYLGNFCIYQQVLAHKNQIFTGIMDDRQICVKILKSNQVQSIEKYKQYIPEMSKIIRQELTKSINKKYKCTNLNSINPPLLKELIQKKYLPTSNKKELYSAFLRVIQTANLDLIEIFSSVYSITIDYKFLKGMQDEDFNFWQHLLSIVNQEFIISFINKYKLFSIFPTQDYSQYLLNFICRLKLNLLFQFTIQHFEAQSGKKAIFAAQTSENKPSISQKGVFYLPIQESIENHFYETYFLIKSSNNSCANFKPSGRFITHNKPELWNYIPEMKRRVDINNTFIVSLREAQDLTFRLDVLIPSIFLDEQEGGPTEVDPDEENKSLKKYTNCLKKFIKDITKRTLKLTWASGTFQKLCFMLFNQDKTKIPEQELTKKYPSQMKIITKMRKFIGEQQLNVDLQHLFECVPEFKPLLLVYNPSVFLSNRDYMNELTGRKDSQIDFSQYLRGIQINFVEFQTKQLYFLEEYINSYFFISSIPLGHPNASFHLTREALLLIFLEVSYHDRNWDSCKIFNMCKTSTNMSNAYELEQQTLYDLSTFLNIRAQGKMAFDLQVWNKIIQEIGQIEQSWKRLGKPALHQYNFNSQARNAMVSNYSKIATKQMQKFTIGNTASILSEVYENHIANCNKKGTLIEISMVLNTLLLQNDIKMLDEKINAIKIGDSIEKYNIKLVKQIKKQIQFTSPTELTLQVKYSIQKHQTNQLSLLFIDYATTIRSLEHSLYLYDLNQQPKVQDLNQFCAAPERQPFLKNYRFIYTISSFKGVKYDCLLSMLEHGHLKKDGIVGKMIYEMERLQEKLIGTKNIKVYSHSDIFGPINFSEEKDDQKIIDCLGFYELIELPKNNQITITYTQKKTPANEQNQLMLRHLKDYLSFYLALSKDQEPSDKIKLQSEVFVTFLQGKNSRRVEIQWWKFGAWTVSEIYCLALHYCSDLSSKIEKILDVRVSFASLVAYYERYLEIGGSQPMKRALECFLFEKEFSKLIQCIVLMITEDVSNIMKIVKGIIIRWDINKRESKKTGKVLIGESARATSVYYEVKDGLLIININLQMAKNLNITDQKGDNCSLLVNRKEFLDCVFTSAQFLTDYFIVRGELNTSCLTISTSITKKLNSTVNFHIDYTNLYKFVDKMRVDKSIKEIQSYLVRLKQYLQNSMDKAINTYLNSQQIANKHQLLLINKCQAIKKNVPFEKIEGEKQLVFDSLQTDPPNGLYEISSLMNQIGNEQRIKNVFLIQIYKSYYTTIVGEGMTFVVGYKSSKKAQVIEITKAQNINLINIVELQYIMLVSKDIPTNDELNKNKIIRIFVTDSNKNLYRLHDQLKDYFLSLPEESQGRNIAEFAPLVASNIKLSFYLEGDRQHDTKQTKTFFIELNESGKFKLNPLPEKPLTPLNSCKKNAEFKEAIGELQKNLKSFFNHNVKIIIDLPQQYSEKYMNADFSHIVSLISADVQQFLLKYQFEPMRNQNLDCKLSVEKQFVLNKNSIIQLRKLALSHHLDSITIRIRDDKSEITFEENDFVIGIDANMTTLPSSSEYLSVIVDRILAQQKKRLPKYVQFVQIDKNESTEILMKYLDLISCIPYQVQEIESALLLIEHMFGVKLSGYRILMDRKKTEIKIKDGVDIHLNVESIEREFYSAQDIIKAYILMTNKPAEDTIKGITYYNPLNKTINIEDCNATIFKLISQDNPKKWSTIEVKAQTQNNKAVISYKDNVPIGSRYYLLQGHNLYCNYFYEADPSLAIKQKNSQGVRCKSKYLYLTSKKPINLNFGNITYIQTDPIFKQQTSNFHLLQSNKDQNKIIIKLLSKNVYLLDIIYGDSMIVHINYASNTNLFNSDIENSKITISSDGEVCLDKTKFIELEAYKKKPVLIKSKNQNTNSEFRENNELASNRDFDLKLGDTENIQNLVYVVNDECKRYITRAGEARVDYIQLCDNDSNPIDYKSKLEVLFVHINKLAVIKPQVFNRNMQLGLKWTPIVRGHYYMYINNVMMNPPYEIGVCAAQADYKKSIVTLPKIKKICYCQETEMMLDLRDHFNNLYTQLEEDIIGDELVIELKCSKMGENIKIDKSQINKYGLKKVKFSFNNSQADAQSVKEIIVEVYLNFEAITSFTIFVQGLSLQQRKKLLQKDISNSSKNYYKDVTVNRNRFLQDLFVIAQKSLHTNISVKFVNEPGVDAGGVKREFYDMIGNQLKNERNPFFKLVNPKTMEYFLNPEILRNKKKLEYMDLFGKYLANSFLNSYLIGVSFSPVFIKLLYDQSIDYEDLLSILPQEQRKQYEFLLKATPAELQDLDLYFSVMIDKKKCVEAELKEGGKDIQVNSENVKQYLQCTAQALVTDRYKQIMIAFKKGFETVLQLNLFKKWIRVTQFWCLTAGNKQITPQLVINYIVFQGNNIDNISNWFRRFITEANHEVLVGFLKFSSGSSSIDFSLASKITVTFENAGQNPKKLPISHTCWKEIVVPKYKNYDIMKKLLTAAFIYCSEGFGFG